ncbi:Nicotinate phosphoribosyltransferase 2 [Dionaea muscipula]
MVTWSFGGLLLCLFWISHIPPNSQQVLKSGVPNFCAVALALCDLGYKAAGIRLDSGDLSYLSIEARKFFQEIEKEFQVPGFGKMSIMASNDLNEETLDHLNKQLLNSSYKSYNKVQTAATAEAF